MIMEVAKEPVRELDDYGRLLEQGKDRPLLLRVYKPRTGSKLFLAIPR